MQSAGSLKFRLALAFGLLVVGMAVGRGAPATTFQLRTGAPPTDCSCIRVVVPGNANVWLSLGLGLATLGLASAIQLISLGRFLATVWEPDVPLGLLLAGTLPHGLLEVPSFILAGACGLGGWRLIPATERDQSARNHLWSDLRLLILAGIGLACAAVVECVITSRVVGSLLP